jgi:hypothetical protein
VTASANAKVRAMRPPIRMRSGLVGVAGAGTLLGAYLAIIAIAQGPAHAVEQLRADALFVGLIALGLGTQVALFVELRAIDRVRRTAAAVTAAGTGTSVAAMLACCAHHLVDLLPILGLSAASAFLTAYKTPLFLVSIGINLAGVAVMVRQLRRAHRACDVMAP